jgi:guanylate kinase
MRRSGILFIVSAPSGAGKTTLCQRLKLTGEFTYSVSCTTRKPRNGETEGKDYHFVDVASFQAKVTKGFFLEHAEVHGNFYGTPLDPIKEVLKQGKDMLLDIDVQGAAQIRSHPDPIIRGALVDVFLMTKTVSQLEFRLRKRNTDDESTIQRRLSAAVKEMENWRKYQYVLFSGSPEDDEQKFRTVVEAERYRTSRLELNIG